MATMTVPHVFATQVAVMQTLPVAGQSPAVAQLPTIPPVPELLLLALLLEALLVALPPPPPIPPVPVVAEPPVPIPPLPPPPDVLLEAPVVEVEPLAELDALEALAVVSPVLSPVVVPPVRESPPQPIAEGKRAKAEAMAIWIGVMRMLATATLPQAQAGVGSDRPGSGDDLSGSGRKSARPFLVTR
jgi:hypothetical protein